MPAPEYAIDAVQHPLDEPVTVWNPPGAPTLNVTYSFESGPSNQFSRSYSGWTPFSDAEKDAVRWGLDQYEAVGNLNFVEQPAGSPDPDIVFGKVDSGYNETWWTYTYTTDANGAVTSRSFDSAVVFARTTDFSNVGAQRTILHELGHALLNKHPGNYDVAGGVPPPPYLPAAEDNADYTVMSYNSGPGGTVGYRLELYDIAAIQARFGANYSSRTGDDTYTFNQDHGIYAIWDTAGFDTIDATFASTRVNIDLRDGHFSQLGNINRVAIAYDVVVEAATGSGFNDSITGNQSDNRLAGGPGNDALVGGQGFDTALFNGQQLDFTWRTNADQSITVTDVRPGTPEGIDTLTEVEALKFLDGLVTLGAPDTSSPPSSEGRVITSPGPGSTLTGGPGNDTLVASQGPDVLTGAGGGDVFSFRALPWNAGHVTDFTLGQDRLDLSAIFQASGYGGADPVADGRLRLDTDGAGGTKVYFDRDVPNAGDWPFLVTTLDHLSPVGLTWAQLSGGGSPPPPPPPDDGQVITSDQYGDTLVGGPGNDTLNAGQGPDVLTGAGGGDAFVYKALPWNAGHITDFAVGADQLDLSAIFQASGYAGSDPVADGRMRFESDGAGGTKVYFDRDAPNSGDWPILVTTLDHVSPTGLTWAQLSGGGGPPPSGGGVAIAQETVARDEGQSGVQAYPFIVSRSGDLGAQATVTWAVTGSGSAPASANDFSGGVLPSGTLTFAPGDAQEVIQVLVAADHNHEYDERFTVTLTGATGATIGAASSQGLIVNDDSALVSLESGTGRIFEGDDAQAPHMATYTVKRFGNSETTTTVEWQVTPSGDHPADAADFGGSLPSGVVTLAPGEDVKAIGFNIAADTTVEPDETFTVTLFNASNATILPPPVQTTIDNDDAQSADGQTIVSPGPGSTLTGGAGADTLVASRGPDQLTGAGGADHFVWPELPWNAGHVTDFTPGADKLDLRALFDASGYGGANPIADGRLEFRPDGSGNTQVYFDPDGPAANPQWPYLITTLDHVTPAQIGAGDWLFQ